MAHCIYISPVRLGSHGRVYDIRLGGPAGDCLGQSRTPFYDGARLLLARGLVGCFEMWSTDIPHPRMSGDVETCAKLMIREDARRGPQVRRWEPFDASGYDPESAISGSAARVVPDHDETRFLATPAP